MSGSDHRKRPADRRPQASAFDFDIDLTLSSVIGIRTTVPSDAFTAEALGTERVGHGVMIAPHTVVLTIGYLVTEADSVWLHLHDGTVAPGHVLAYDQETGFGLIQPLARVDVPALALGSSAGVAVGDSVLVGAFGGRPASVTARVIAKQAFAGYWEYLVEEAIFTRPAHPNWGGTALIDRSGKLVGIGSLRLEQAHGGGSHEPVNMVVPIDLLAPILADLLTLGRPNHPARPWLGFYATEVGDQVVVAGIAARGPAMQANLQAGDIVLGVAGAGVTDLAGLFRRVWALGTAGVKVPLSVHREGRTFDVTLNSADRAEFLKRPRMH
jgi:S1-C subfamily serine protease